MKMPCNCFLLEMANKVLNVFLFFSSDNTYLYYSLDLKRLRLEDLCYSLESFSIMFKIKIGTVLKYTKLCTKTDYCAKTIHICFKCSAAIKVLQISIPLKIIWECCNNYSVDLADKNSCLRNQT